MCFAIPVCIVRRNKSATRPRASHPSTHEPLPGQHGRCPALPPAGIAHPDKHLTSTSAACCPPAYPQRGEQAGTNLPKTLIAPGSLPDTSGRGENISKGNSHTLASSRVKPALPTIALFSLLAPEDAGRAFPCPLCSHADLGCWCRGQQRARWAPRGGKKHKGNSHRSSSGGQAVIKYL